MLLLLQEALSLFMALGTVLTEVEKSCLPASEVPPHDAVTERWGVEGALCCSGCFSNSGKRTAIF